jgi:cytoplasmic tRNA 2-thiolation protein 2
MKMEDLMDEDDLKEYFNSFLQSTISDVFEIMIEHFLVKYARNRGIKKILVGNNGTRLASKLMSDTSKGRGYQLPSKLSFIDVHHKDVEILRPMKNFFSKDVAFFNYYLKLKTTPIPVFLMKKKDRGTINQLCENFIIRLQCNFPSTVHTILRSAEKIQTEPVDNQLLCDMCHGELMLDEVDLCYSCQVLISHQKKKLTFPPKEITEFKDL